VAAKFKIVVITSAALGMAALLATATAQPYGPESGMMGRGMMGSWMMGGRGAGGMCNPAAAGFSGWRADKVAELIKPTDAQRPKFEEFKAASIKSTEAMRDACQADVPETIIGRTEAMEKRMDTMLQAIRTVRPALEALYATLSDEQKARLDANSHRGRFWH
jgi:LTXXQ motif family protein